MNHTASSHKYFNRIYIYYNLYFMDRIIFYRHYFIYFFVTLTMLTTMLLLYYVYSYLFKKINIKYAFVPCGIDTVIMVKSEDSWWVYKLVSTLGWECSGYYLCSIQCSGILSVVYEFWIYYVNWASGYESRLTPKLHLYIIIRYIFMTNQYISRIPMCNIF